MHSSTLLLSLIPAVVADLPFQKVFKAKPALANVKPIVSPAVNRQAVAASIISVLNDRHGSATKGQAQKTTAPNPNGKHINSSKTKKTKKTKTKKHKTTAKHTTKHAKRDGTCANQVYPFNYASTPNTPNGFLTDLYLTSQSTSARPPAGYSQNFTAQYGSLFAPNYINYYQQSSYNNSACAAICDSVPSCQGFNIYFERDPTLDPAQACPNPTAAVSVRCALWGVNVNSGQAGNIGEYRNNFLIVVQGSNGYNKNPVPASVAGYASPTALAAAIDPSSIPSSAPVQYLGYTFSGAGYDPSVCSRFCASTTASNRAAALASGATSYNACNYFNAFLVTYNATSQGMYCQAFTGDASAYATLYQQTVNGVNYGLTYSYGYGINTPDSGLFTTAVASATSSAAVVVSSVASSAAAAVSSVASSAAGNAGGIVSSVAGGLSGVVSSAVAAPAASSSSSPAAAVTTSSKVTTYAAYTTQSVNSGTAFTIVTTTIPPTVAGGTATVQVRYPTPVQTCGNAGSSTSGAANYAAYDNLLSNLAGVSAFLPETYKTKTPIYNGTTTYIGEYNDLLNTPVTIYGNANKKGQALVLSHTFYIFANQPGTYTITIPMADDLAFAWIGAKALSGWNRANADVNQIGTSLSLSSYSFSVVLNTGDYRAARIIWANTALQGELDVVITAPDGSKYAVNNPGTNTGSLGPQIVRFPCDSSIGAQFPAWGSET